MSEQNWWCPTMNMLAGQLSKGVLNEMKKRILNSNIKKRKLKLNEGSTNMREFFEREIERHNRKKTKLKQKQKTLQAITNN